MTDNCQGEDVPIHAALVTVQIEPSQTPAPAAALMDDILPKITSAPGLPLDTGLSLRTVRGSRFFFSIPKIKLGRRRTLRPVGQPRKSPSKEWRSARPADRERTPHGPPPSGLPYRTEQSVSGPLTSPGLGEPRGIGVPCILPL